MHHPVWTEPRLKPMHTQMLRWRFAPRAMPQGRAVSFAAGWPEGAQSWRPKMLAQATSMLTQATCSLISVKLRFMKFSSYKHLSLADSWDAIIIGSGIGGLSTAALLSIYGGQRVLVLERHYVPGGYTHVFDRHGYEWDVGLHYIGELQSEESVLRRTFDKITDGQLEWAAMPDVYDRAVIGNQPTIL
jgi:hypothetical protein